MSTLRYFCQGSGDADVVGLLRQVGTRWGLDCEVRDLSLHGEYNETMEREVYATYFKPHARALKQRIGQSITSLRSGTGRYFVSVPGTMAVFQNGAAEWFAIGKEDILAFLASLLKRGPRMLETLIRTPAGAGPR